MDPTVSDLVKKIGLTPENLTKHDKQFIYDFLEKRGGVDALKQEMTATSPRPLPTVPPAPVVQRPPQPQGHHPSSQFYGNNQQTPPPPSQNSYGSRGPARSATVKSHAPPPPPRDQPANAGKGQAPPPPPPARPLPVVSQYNHIFPFNFHRIFVREKFVFWITVHNNKFFE